MRAAATALALLVAGSAGACAEGESAPPLEPVPAVGLPESVESMVYGTPRACREDASCPGKICYYGRCGGILSVDQRWMADVIGGALKARCEAQPALAERVVERLAEILTRARAEAAHRARAAVGLELLNRPEPIEAALAALPEPVAEVAAMSLTRLGREAGVAHTAALTETDDVAMAAEALRALGTSKLPSALPYLLPLLTPELDGDLVNAALVALGDLGDTRAIRPLVAFLDKAPEHLVLQAHRSLKRLAKEPPAPTSTAWEAWIAKHQPPQPPPYRPRTFSSEEDIGLPAP